MHFSALWSLRIRGCRPILHALPVLVFTALFLSALPVQATVNLVTNDSGFINGALFTVDQGRGGTGIFESFVMIQGGNNPVEQGYNTSYRPKNDWPDILDDVNSSLPTTHDIQLRNVPFYDVNGISYCEFALDISQQGGASGDYLSLDRVILFTTASGEQTPASIAAFATVRYDMDALPDGDTVLLDARRFVSPGSGKYDMLMLVPRSYFSAAGLNDYVYLYSTFGAVGGEYAANDGPEEWRIKEGFDAGDDEGDIPIPEPLTSGLFLLSVLGGLSAWRRKN